MALRSVRLQLDLLLLLTWFLSKNCNCLPVCSLTPQELFLCVCLLTCKYRLTSSLSAAISFTCW